MSALFTVTRPEGVGVQVTRENQQYHQNSLEFCHMPVHLTPLLQEELLQKILQVEVSIPNTKCRIFHFRVKFSKVSKTQFQKASSKAREPMTVPLWLPELV